METINSLLENLKQKATNPFLGTIIFVAIVRYWDVVYAFFAFDDDCDMLYKQTYIHNYFAVLNFWKEIAIIIGEAFAIIIATYLLLTASKFIMDFYHKHLLSRAAKIVDKKSVKTLEEYQSLERALAESIEQVSKVNKQNDELEMRVGRFKSDIADKDLKISELNIQVGDLSQKNDNLVISVESLEIDNKSKGNIINDLNHHVEELKGYIEDTEADARLLEKTKNKNELYETKISELEETIKIFEDELKNREIIIPDFEELENSNTKYIIQNDARYKLGEWIDFHELPQWLNESNLNVIYDTVDTFVNSTDFKTLPKKIREGIKKLIENNLLIDFLSLLNLFFDASKIFVNTGYLEEYINLNLIASSKDILQNEEIRISDIQINESIHKFYNSVVKRYK
jgi:hypothetical protein